AVYGDAAREAGAGLAEGTEVRVLQESADKLYLVIPNVEATAEAPELSERSTRAELEASILLDAMSDDGAKKALLADPRGVYETKLASVREGAKLPDNMSVEAFEESDNVLYFRVPNAPAEHSGELSEEELEEVAGGIVAVGVAIASTVAVGAVAAAVLLVAEEPAEFGQN
ncbi:MAG: class IIb bacteriocin, lactobin A/cerein 7B family, partial [Holophagales bacterium]|nr:class IIb bacteriocin, lactobin A/cerein 7B family [Holophagales bacterium]